MIEFICNENERSTEHLEPPKPTGIVPPPK
jgi:hypothetical protein